MARQLFFILSFVIYYFAFVASAGIDDVDPSKDSVHPAATANNNDSSGNDIIIINTGNESNTTTTAELEEESTVMNTNNGNEESKVYNYGGGIRGGGVNDHDDQDDEEKEKKPSSSSSITATAATNTQHAHQYEYGVNVYECGSNLEQLNGNDRHEKIVNTIIRMCFEPDQNTIHDGITIDTVDTWTWTTTNADGQTVEKIDVADGRGDDVLSDIVCYDQGTKCVLQSLLPSAFYIRTLSVTGSGQATLTHNAGTVAVHGDIFPIKVNFSMKKKQQQEEEITILSSGGGSESHHGMSLLQSILSASFLTYYFWM